MKFTCNLIILCNLDLLMKVIFCFIILRFIAMRRIILCLKCKTDAYVIVAQTLTEPMQNRRISDKKKLELKKVLLGS